MNLTIDEKLQILKELENGIKPTELCTMYKTAISTIYSIKKNK
ncbi:hypothetical protein A3Q56_07916 [Intoshia linei]|uniref:HTH psq-type domain-containing protein n=1 Tax=Intoshia linei TaxID=1819745 RepID=A0A177ARD1_9BILA|nr:hypothetical protein A3Q56_07916 [Intoshia linei]